MDRRAWIAWLGVAALSIAMRAPVAALPFERDEGGYAYIAQRWALGEIPYRDAFDQKPPAIFAFYALAFAVAGESLPGLRWAAQGLLLAGLAALAGVGAQLLSARVGVAAAALAALLTVHPSFLGNAVNTELLAFAPLAGGAWAALRARRGGPLWSAAAGALGAAALLCKPVVAPIIAFQVATAISGRRVLAHAVAAVAGGVFILAPPVLYFAAVGAWDDFLDATVWNNLAYGSGTRLGDYPSAFGRGIARSLAPFAPVYAAVVLALVALPLEARARRAALWLAGWLATSIAAVAAGGYFHDHYFLLAAAPLALLAAAGLDAAVGWIAPRSRPTAALLFAAVLAVLVHAIARDAWYYQPGPQGRKLTRLYGGNPFAEAQPLARWLAGRAGPGDRVFLYGSEPEVLFYAGLRSASRYIYVYPLTMPFGAVAARQREALAELRAAPPRWVVRVLVNSSLLEQPGTPPDLREQLEVWLERDYELAALVLFDEARSGPIVPGEAARSLWRDLARGGGLSRVAYAVWERSGPRGERPRGSQSQGSS